MSYANKRGHAKAFDSGIAGAEFITSRDCFVTYGMQTASQYQFGPNYAYQVARKALTQINATVATVGRILIHTLFYSFHATPQASGLIYLQCIF